MSLREYLDAPTDTLTGPLGGRAARAQIVVVPSLLALCMIGSFIAVMLTALLT